jgi:hypothetical protein
LTSEEAFVKTQYLIFIISCTGGFIIALLTYIYVFPVLVSWGFGNEAYGVLMASFFFPWAGIMYLSMILDTRRSLARKKSLLTGVMIKIPYKVWIKTHNDERVREKGFDQGSTEIDLNFKKIRSIDLSVLDKFPNLEHLDLSNNDINQIDLSPLSNCRNLRSLLLSRNNISKIDLHPIAMCSKIHTLYLADNELNLIDLSPLRECSKLEYLHLQENQLQNVDLKPLESCTRLVNLFLDDNPIQKLDISPLQKCMKLDVIAFGDSELVSSQSLDDGKWPSVILEIKNQVDY